MKTTSKNIIIIFGFIFLILLLVNSPLFSQIDTSKIPADSTLILSDTTDINNNSYKEKLFENSNDEIDNSYNLDYLEELEKNPFDLNTVTQEELESIPFLNTILSKRIIDYRVLNGGFKSKAELTKVEGINSTLYENIQVFLVVKNSGSDFIIDDSGNLTTVKDKGNKSLLKNFTIRYRSRFQQDLQTKKGFTDSTYPGSKAKLYNQFHIEYKLKGIILTGNFTMEKDPGETNLADFKSFYLQASSSTFLKTVIGGDYVLNFGQGVGMWSGYSYSKGIESINSLKKKEKTLEPYASVNEIQFFRGAATGLNFGKYNFFLFYSNKDLDASIDTTLGEASTLYVDGYHRTLSEQSRQNSIKERFFGGRFYYDNNLLRIGLTYWDSKFSKSFEPDAAGKQLYSFSGNYANMLSLDYDYVLKNFNIFGEVAKSQNGAIAGITSLQINFLTFADAIFSYRNYAKDFIPLHSFAFGERSGNTQNEVGYYAGIELRPMKGLNINAYFDQFKFPYRTYSEVVPTLGNDFLCYAEWKLNRNLLLEVKYKNENKEENKTITDIYNRSIKVIENRNQMNIRTGITYQISKNVRIRTRFEYVYVGYKYYGGDNKGFLLFTDFRFLAAKNLTIDSRLMYFQTDDYDSRIYEFEDDIKGVLTNIALYGKGTRWFVVMKYKPLNFIELQAKYSVTYSEGVKTIGSGNDLINNNLNNKLNFGMEIKF
jgi:hypothetical protein